MTDTFSAAFSNRLDAARAKVLETSSQYFASWKEHPEYALAIEEAFEMVKRELVDIENGKSDVPLKLLEAILATRLLFEGLRASYKKGEFKGALFVGVGQEALGAGIGVAVKPHDVVARDHRSPAAVIARGMPVYNFWTNHFMRATSPTGGYDANTHFMNRELNDLGFLASDMALSSVIANGATWYLNRKRELESPDHTPIERTCGVAMFGDGAASCGVVHGGMNLAKAWPLPVLFAILDNQVSLRTSAKEQHGEIDLSNRGFAYEMPAFTVDGDNVFDVYCGARFLLEFARRANHPALLHALTFRRSGHNETEGTAYVEELFKKDFLEHWMDPGKDPLTQARKLCERFGLVTEPEYKRLLERKRDENEEAHQRALKDPEPSVAPYRNALIDPICDTVRELAEAHAVTEAKKVGVSTKKFREAIQDAIKEEFAHDPLLLMLGEDIGYPGGGVFEVTKPLVVNHPELRDRIRNSPLDESAIAGFVVGAGLLGGRVALEYQFWNFFLAGPSPILTLAATRPFMENMSIPGVLRGPTGYAPQSNHYHETWPITYLAKALAIKIVVPSTPEDAKGLLKSAFRDPDLVAFLEEMSFYGVTGEVPDGEYFTPFTPVVRREGKDVTIITWGPKMLKLALESAGQLASQGIDAEVIDLRVLRPLDTAFILESVQKTGRYVVLEEDSGFMGFGREVVASIDTSITFYKLKARSAILAGLDTPIPAHLTLEDFRLPSKDKLVGVVKELMAES